MIIKLYYPLKGLKSLNEDWKPSLKMLSESEEQKRYGKLTERQNIHSVSEPPNTDPPPEPKPSSLINDTPPTRQDLYNMIKFLEKDKRELNITIDDMQIKIKSLENQLMILNKNATT